MNTYGSIEEVEGLVPAAGSIDSDSKPSIRTVTGWLNEGFDVINTCIKSQGFNPPVTKAQSELYGTVKALNNLYAQIKLLRAKSLDAVIGTEENKAEDLQDIFDKGISDLKSMNMIALGLTEVGGTAETSKRVVRIRTVNLVR